MLGFKTQKVHWPDEGKIRANFLVQAGEIYTFTQTVVVCCMYQWQIFHWMLRMCVAVNMNSWKKRKHSKNPLPTHTVHRLGRSIVCVNVVFLCYFGWDSLWFVCMCNSLQLTSPVKQYTSLRIIILNAHTCTHNEVPLTQARCSWNIVGDGKLSSSFSGVNIIHRLKGNWKQPDWGEGTKH